MNHLIDPHAGSLIDLMVDQGRMTELKERSRDWPSVDLSSRQVCDLEMLLGGVVSPLTGFMGSADYDAVCAEMRLRVGTLWPIPIILDVSDALAEQLASVPCVALRDPEGVMLAALSVEEVWQPDRSAELTALFGDEEERSEDKVRGTGFVRRDLLATEATPERLAGAFGIWRTKTPPEKRSVLASLTSRSPASSMSGAPGSANSLPFPVKMLSSFRYPCTPTVRSDM